MPLIQRIVGFDKEIVDKIDTLIAEGTIKTSRAQFVRDAVRSHLDYYYSFHEMDVCARIKFITDEMEVLQNYLRELTECPKMSG